MEHLGHRLTTDHVTHVSSAGRHDNRLVLFGIQQQTRTQNWMDSSTKRMGAVWLGNVWLRTVRVMRLTSEWRHHFLAAAAVRNVSGSDHQKGATSTLMWLTCWGRHGDESTVTSMAHWLISTSKSNNEKSVVSNKEKNWNQRNSRPIWPVFPQETNGNEIGEHFLLSGHCVKLQVCRDKSLAHNYGRTLMTFSSNYHSVQLYGKPNQHLLRVAGIDIPNCWYSISNS